MTKSVFNTRVEIEGLSAIHGDLIKTKEYFDSIDVGKVSLFTYYTFARVVSEDLLKRELFKEYKAFIDKYNSFVEENFGEAIKIQNEISKKVSFFSGCFTPEIYLKDKTKIFSGKKFKQENKLEQIIYNDLAFWSDEWEVKRQQYVGFGKCDISIVLGNEKVAIELKKDTAKRKDVYQTLEYSLKNSGYKPILIAADFPDDVIELAKELKIICYEYHLGTYVEQNSPSNIFLERVSGPVKKLEIEKWFEEMEGCGCFMITYTDENTTTQNFQKYSDEAVGILDRWAKETAILSERLTEVTN